MSALGAKSEAALPAAMARLLDGRPERIDDAPTVSNLAYEAGVSRATANRAVGLPADGDHYSKPSRSARALKAELRAMRGTEIAAPHGLVRTPARYIQVLTLQAAGRNDVIERVCGKNWPDPLVLGLSP